MRELRGLGVRIPGRPRGARSRDNVGEQLVLNDRNLIFQGELLLLEPFNQQLVGAAGRLERNDFVIKVAMLGAQVGERLAEFFVIATLHLGPDPFPLPACQPQQRT